MENNVISYIEILLLGGSIKKKEEHQNHISYCIKHGHTVSSRMITQEKGKKHSDDRVIFFHGHKVTFKEWAKVFLEFCKNEDRIYPMPRYLGRNMLINFLHDCLREGSVSDSVLRKYKLDTDR